MGRTVPKRNLPSQTFLFTSHFVLVCTFPQILSTSHDLGCQKSAQNDSEPAEEAGGVVPVHRPAGQM